jgi:hypothetical protein
MLKNMYNSNLDGRINLGHRDVNAVVSIYDPNFKNQVEGKIWPCVETLINKGYITVGSCDGHHQYDITNNKNSYLHVSVIFNNIEEANLFKEKIKSHFITSKLDYSYKFTLDWFNIHFIRSFKDMYIVTIYPIHKIVSENKVLKKLFITHLANKIKSL